jgi:hypothetical protein
MGDGNAESRRFGEARSLVGDEFNAMLCKPFCGVMSAFSLFMLVGNDVCLTGGSGKLC